MHKKSDYIPPLETITDTQRNLSYSRIHSIGHLASIKYEYIMLENINEKTEAHYLVLLAGDWLPDRK